MRVSVMIVTREVCGAVGEWLSSDGICALTCFQVRGARGADVAVVLLNLSEEVVGLLQVPPEQL